MSSLLRISVLLAGVEGLHTRGQEESFLPINEAYTFDRFVRDFGRVYEVGSKEYAHRSGIFQDSLLQIRATNSRAERSWTAGVYPFMDWTGAERSERLYGYDPSASRHLVEPAAPAVVTLQTGVGSMFLGRVYGGSDDSFEAQAPPPRNQGAVCGSCWAFAAVEAVEAQLMKPGSHWPSEKGKPRLSAQALVDCVPNPKHCGGNGGCGGATPQLAFDFMRSSGVPLDENVPYAQANGKCPLEPYPAGWMRVTVTGWRQLPSNQAQPLMQAIVNDGPVAVAADAHHWSPYRSGIYDECSKDAIPNHAVLAKGYGVSGGTKYWLIQNSWSSSWGEGGAIRLLRHDDEDSWCGIDSRPQEGSACDSEADQNVTVCGTCGILYDTVIPTVGTVTVQHLHYSTDSASADAAAASLTAEANLEQGAAVPRLTEQVLVDPQASYGESSEAVSAYEVLPAPTLETQGARSVEARRAYVDNAFDSTTEAPMASEAPHSGPITAHWAGQARHSPVQELATQHFTIAQVVDTWSSLSDDAAPSVSDPADAVAMHLAEDETPQVKAVPSSGNPATSLAASMGMVDTTDFGDSSDSARTSVMQPSADAVQAGMAAQIKAYGGVWSSQASLADPPEFDTATPKLDTDGSQAQTHSNLAARTDRSVSGSGSLLPGWSSHQIDDYLRR